MQNPQILESVNRKIKTFNYPSGYFSFTKPGVQFQQVNAEPKNDVLTCFLNTATTGSKYILNQYSSDVSLGNMVYITDASAVKFELFASATVAVRPVVITGVNQLGEEINESITVPIAPTTIQTVNFYKCIININMFGGGLLNLAANEQIHCRPAGGSPYNTRVSLTPTLKLNPLFMVGSKNGQTRRARLRAINEISGTATDTYVFHVFNGNITGTNTGVYNPKLRMMRVENPTVQGIRFPQDGGLDIGPGEMVAVYREGAVSGATQISCTWEFYNAA